MVRLLAIAGAAFLGACAMAPNVPNQPAPGGWGKYSGPIQTEWDLDGRQMKLLARATYLSPEGRAWVAPKDWRIDGASIPQAFWSITGGPFEGLYREASVFHDVACDQRTARWQDVHLMFYTGMRCSGESELKAKILYAAVYRFGPRWDTPQTGTLLKPRSFLAAGRAPTKDEAEQLAAWVRKNNPSLEQIQETPRSLAVPGKARAE